MACWGGCSRWRHREQSACAVFDTQCGAKLFRVSEDTAALFAEPFCSRWIFDVELFARMIVRSRNTGPSLSGRVYELPLEKWQDVAGSNVRSSDFAKAAFELAEIYWRYFVRNAPAQRPETSIAGTPIAQTAGKSPRRVTIDEPRRKTAAPHKRRSGLN